MRKMMDSGFTTSWLYRLMKTFLWKGYLIQKRTELVRIDTPLFAHLRFDRLPVYNPHDLAPPCLPFCHWSRVHEAAQYGKRRWYFLSSSVEAQ